VFHILERKKFFTVEFVGGDIEICGTDAANKEEFIWRKEQELRLKIRLNWPLISLFNAPFLLFVDFYSKINGELLQSLCVQVRLID